jgi:hypothetical protein
MSLCTLQFYLSTAATNLLTAITKPVFVPALKMLWQYVLTFSETDLQCKGRLKDLRGKWSNPVPISFKLSTVNILFQFFPFYNQRRSSTSMNIARFTFTSFMGFIHRPKYQINPVILSVIHRRKNPSDSTWLDVYFKTSLHLRRDILIIFLAEPPLQQK